MAALTDLSDLINRQTGGNSGTPENLFFHKVPRVAGAAATAPIAGRGASLWQYEGMPTGGAVPTSAAIPDRSTTGALPFAAPGGSREKWLIGASIAPLVSGVFLLYDRLFHIGGLSGTVTTAQTVQGSPASPALTRNTGGAGNFAFYEIYTIIGTTSTTLTMTYTDQDGNTGNTSTINIGNTGFREVTRAQRIPLAAGDSGIQSIQSVQLSATTGTAGNFGITIAQPLAWIPVGAAGVAGWRDYTTGLPGIPAIDPNACLSLLFIPSVATAPEVFGALGFVEK
ncbi:hypothetical protein UFOVP835_53 [uncultured Caudovirales phage]|uniref:Uncharacterized protein n=1 Tax=uncultured Caudovirales phage TaxID=2100421 RepID=A0A6J5PB94_9CAUD|nr:hypothetical protein UFOVP835_53 [uncultured Caudovirales phage]